MAKSRKTSPVLDALKKATRGLLFISETESKLVPFLWKADVDLDEKTILTAGDYEYDKASPVEKTTLERFFRAVPPEDRAKFDRLAGVLKEHLRDLRVYKIGEAEKDAYLVGKTADGEWAGVRTTVVET